MARTTRSRRKMANTTDAPSPASSLLSSTTTTPFTSPTSTSYSTEGYTFNYSGLPSLGGYSLEDLNYTELWVDVWNSTEASNVTERLNTTVLSSGAGYCDEWEAAQHKLFQVNSLLHFYKRSNSLSLRELSHRSDRSIFYSYYILIKIDFKAIAERNNDGLIKLSN